MSRILRGPSASRAPGSKIDYIGISLLALGVGALQIMLDKGQEDDWFGSHFILTSCDPRGGRTGFARSSGNGFARTRVVDVRLFKNLNFLGANVMMFILGVMLLFAAW